MRKIIYFFLLLSYCSISIAQNCSTDSIVKQFIQDRGDDFENNLRIDSFNIINGTMSSTLIDLSNNLIIQYQQGNFQRTYITFNSNSDTLKYVLMDGTGTGYTKNKRIDFTYKPVSNLILSRTEYNGSGNNWSLFKTETWSYNANNLITNYTETNASGNILKIIYNYTSNIRQSILHQVGVAATWTNDKLFTIVYNAGRRDSLKLKKWDAATSTWIDSLAAKYDTIFGAVANLSDTIHSGAYTLINSYSFDTLDILTSEYHSNDSIPMNETFYY